MQLFRALKIQMPMPSLLKNRFLWSTILFPSVVIGANLILENLLCRFLWPPPQRSLWRTPPKKASVSRAAYVLRVLALVLVFSAGILLAVRRTRAVLAKVREKLAREVPAELVPIRFLRCKFNRTEGLSEKTKKASSQVGEAATSLRDTVSKFSTESAATSDKVVAGSSETLPGGKSDTDEFFFTIQEPEHRSGRLKWSTKRASTVGTAARRGQIKWSGGESSDSSAEWNAALAEVMMEEGFDADDVRDTGRIDLEEEEDGEEGGEEEEEEEDGGDDDQEEEEEEEEGEETDDDFSDAANGMDEDVYEHLIVESVAESTENRLWKNSPNRKDPFSALVENRKKRMTSFLS